MLCAALTTKGHPCKKNVWSGHGMEMGGHVFPLCQTHALMHEQGKQVKPYWERSHKKATSTTPKREESKALTLFDTMPQGTYSLKEENMEDINPHEDNPPMVEELYVVMGTGTRQLQLASPEEKSRIMSVIQYHIRRLQEEHGEMLVVVTGMAEGFDSALARASLSLGVLTAAFVPNTGYGSYYWGRNSLTGQGRYRQFEELLARMHSVQYTSERYGFDPKALYGNPDTGEWSMRKGSGLIHMNFLRNRHMVQYSDEAIVWKSNSSGTKHAIGTIKEADIPYTELS